MREFAKEIDVSFVKIEEVIGAGRHRTLPLFTYVMLLFVTHTLALLFLLLLFFLIVLIIIKAYTIYSVKLIP